MRDKRFARLAKTVRETVKAAHRLSYRGGTARTRTRAVVVRNTLEQVQEWMRQETAAHERALRKALRLLRATRR